MFSNTFNQETKQSYFATQPNWDPFGQDGSQNLYSCAPPAPGISEMNFEKNEEIHQKMEEDYNSYDQQQHYFGNLEDELEPSRIQRYPSFRLDFEDDSRLYGMQENDCKRDDQHADEEVRSVTTRESALDENSRYFNIDGFSMTTDDHVSHDDASIQADLKRTIAYLLKGRSDDEKAYIKKIFPTLLESIRELLSNRQFVLNDKIIQDIVNELLQNKKKMVADEDKVLYDIIQQEMEQVRQSRPEKMITEDVLVWNNRKERKALKGNRNSSRLNHFNENYVSNIFQFAKRNYPEDKEVQKIGNERNVSALNFRRLMSTKLTDGVMERKGKVRIAECGKELVGNIEYWMRDGYFEQCTDREKYIEHKEKALNDLKLFKKNLV